jgi:hypothetical protein
VRRLKDVEIRKGKFGNPGILAPLRLPRHRRWVKIPHGPRENTQYSSVKNLRALFGKTAHLRSSTQNNIQRTLWLKLPNLITERKKFKRPVSKQYPLPPPGMRSSVNRRMMIHIEYLGSTRDLRHRIYPVNGINNCIDLLIEGVLPLSGSFGGEQ